MQVLKNEGFMFMDVAHLNPEEIRKLWVIWWSNRDDKIAEYFEIPKSVKIGKIDKHLNDYYSKVYDWGFYNE